MSTRRWFLAAAFSLVVLLGLVASGCGNSDTTTTPPPGEGDQAKPLTTKPPAQPLIPQQKVVDWCGEHGVPESICTRCNGALIAEFKKKGDWCNTHSVPESQCIACKPELDAKFKAMAPKPGR